MNTTTKRYSNISQDLNRIVDELLKNKNLLKWLTYLVDDPLSLPDVPPGKVLGKQIVLNRVNPDVLPKSETKLFIVPKGGRDHRVGTLMDTVYEVSILSPHELGYIYPSRLDRYAEIASEVARSLDERHITGVGDVQVSSGFTAFKVNQIYSGLMLHITVTNPTIRIKGAR